MRALFFFLWPSGVHNREVPLYMYVYIHVHTCTLFPPITKLIMTSLVVTASRKMDPALANYHRPK